MRKNKKINIIYKDDQIVVCEKPKGIPVSSDKTGDMDLLHQLKNQLFFEENKKRLRIKSDCQIQKAGSMDELKNMAGELLDQENCATYIYAKYENFDEFMANLAKLSLRKIESESNLY